VSRLEDLVAEFVERREAGEAVDPQAFAASHPDLEARLLSVLGELVDVEDMFTGDLGSVPKTVGRWEVLGVLGSGGMGRVLEVIDRSGKGPHRALKLLNPTASLDPRQEERFRREAEVLQAFEHPGVVRVHEVGQESGCAFLVMDLVEGQPLSDVISARQREVRASAAGSTERTVGALLTGDGAWPTRAAELVAELARTMAAAHRAGLIHRDLKPGNVIVRPDGKPIVIDFGLARTDGAATLTGTGDVLGTPHFMSPEQAAGRVGDHRVDIYGLGAILYHLVALDVPHPGSDPMSVVESVRRVPARPPRAVNASVPRPLDAIIRRAMGYRPARRFPDADALAVALERFVAGDGSVGWTLPPSARLEDLWRWHRRKVAAGAIAALVAVALWLGWGSWTHNRDTQRAALVRQASLARLEQRAEETRELGAQIEALGGGDLGAYFAGRQPDGELGKALRDGDAALARDDVDAALAAYGRAAELGSPMASGLLGLAAAGAGASPPEAEAVALRELPLALRAFPESTRLHRALGELHARSDRWDDAAASLEAAAVLLDTDHDLWHEVAKAWLKARQRDRGAAAVSRALELAGDDAPAKYERTLAAAVPPGEGQEILEDLVRRFPTTGSLWHNLGFVFHKQHDLPNAAENYRRALQHKPKDVASLLNLAWIHAGLDADCAECKASLDAHPELLDRDVAADYMVRALDVDGGQFPNALRTLIQVARFIDRTEALRTALQRWLQREDLSERHLGRLARALQQLK